MDDLETGKDKIKKICEILKNETLEPAKQEAQKIIEGAQAQAHDLILEAEKKSAEFVRQEKMKMEKERALFQTSLIQASKQALETLKQEIENTLFNKQLEAFIQKATSNQKASAELITAIVEAIEKEGTSANFSAKISKSLPAAEVNALLAKGVLDQLREKSVVVGSFDGGVELQLHDKQLTLDVTDDALKELLGKYLRSDFRKMLFA